MKKGKGIALLPIGVFLVLYLGLGILFEYVMEIPMGFYNVPIVVAFLAAILVACLQNRALDFDKKLEIMAQGVGDKNIITMRPVCALHRPAGDVFPDRLHAGGDGRPACAGAGTARRGHRRAQCGRAGAQPLPDHPASGTRRSRGAGPEHDG